MSTPESPKLADLTLSDLLLKRRSLKRSLSTRETLQPIRIAVLGGSTTSELVDFATLHLLESGFCPTFHQTEYGRFEADAIHSPEALIAFRPDLVYIHTSVLNLQHFPPTNPTEEDFQHALQTELQRFQHIWQSLDRNLHCTILQNTFELPPNAILGNLDCTLGQTRFILELNRAFAQAAATNPRLLLQDVASISARTGLNHWFDAERWHAYKIPTTPQASIALAQSLAAIVRGLYGATRKVLVLDLDNTLWGGVIGDDGPAGIQIGRETALAEAFTTFQQYCLALRNRGILLAVCSKNDEPTARQGFEHPDSILKLEHISSFHANWNPKPENLEAIARDLNVGLDALVFADDNPAERALVQAQLPAVAVPHIGHDPAHYARILESHRYFEQVCLSEEDLDRASLYQQNHQRTAQAAHFADYGQYLDSLEMSAEIEPFKPLYLERITQLINKTNQFNLTTRRYTLAELQSTLADPNTIALYGRLTDRFGDNGLISNVLGDRQGTTLDIDLWLMSCRVLKRDMESAMLDALVDQARPLGITTLRGLYIPTRKNAMVATHYPTLGFETIAKYPNGPTTYTLDITRYTPRNQHIRVLAPVQA